MKNKIITKIILNSIALALSIAAVVLTVLKEPMETISIIIGLAIFCIALNGLISARI